MIKLGIIGYRNHAQRIIELLEKNSNCKLKFIYHPKKKIRDERGTNSLSDLFTCDGVIIASPNHTHLKYIQKILSASKAKILCEKPPVNNNKDLDDLQSIPTNYKKRIFFNFNFRFSELNNQIKKMKNSSELGKLIQINITSTQGLAFKKEYINSWRSNGRKNLHSILDTLAIHYIDLMNFHFGKIKEIKYMPYLNSNIGTSFDTAQITLLYNKGIIVNITTSYAAPLINEISILGTNGFFTIRNNFAKMYSPRNNFDKNGFFIYPNLKSKKRFVNKNEYNKSLKNSVFYFIETLQKKGNFNILQFNSSISTTKIIIDLHSKKSNYHRI